NLVSRRASGGAVAATDGFEARSGGTGLRPVALSAAAGLITSAVPSKPTSSTHTTTIVGIGFMMFAYPSPTGKTRTLRLPDRASYHLAFRCARLSVRSAAGLGSA